MCPCIQYGDSGSPAPLRSRPLPNTPFIFIVHQIPRQLFQARTIDESDIAYGCITCMAVYVCWYCPPTHPNTLSFI